MGCLFSKIDKISVIIPCYNSGSTIKKAVRSVKTQTWKNIEIIIVNDGSTDKYTLKILKEMKDVCLIHQINKGLPSARNAGIKKSTGKYITFLDSDDWIENNAIELMYKFLKTNNSSFVFCNMALEGDKNEKLKKNFNFFEQLFINHIPYFILINKKIIKKVGCYDEKMTFGYEDWELNLRLGVNNFFPSKVNKSLFHYNVSSSGMLNSMSKKKHSIIFNYIKTKHKHTYKFLNIIKLYIKWKNENRNYHLLIYIILYLSYLIMPHNIFNKYYNFLYKSKNKLIKI